MFVAKVTGPGRLAAHQHIIAMLRSLLGRVRSLGPSAGGAARAACRGPARRTLCEKAASAAEGSAARPSLLVEGQVGCLLLVHQPVDHG